MRVAIRSLLVLSLSLPLAVPVTAKAQVEITLAVLPFGALPAAGGAHRAGPTLGQEAVTIAGASGLYTVVDRSSDAAIEDELKRAEGFRNFDSKVQLKTTGQLNASVLLIGVVEHQAIEVTRATQPGGQPSYSATLGVRVKLVRTQTGEVIKSTYFSLRNATAVSEAAKGKGLTRLVPKELREAVAKKIDDQVRATASRSDVNLSSHTADDAIRAAAQSMAKPLGEFLEGAYGAAVAASRAK
jgi:hypothetical protein